MQLPFEMRAPLSCVTYSDVLVMSLLILAHTCHAIPYSTSLPPTACIQGRQSNNTIQNSTNNIQQQGWTSTPNGRGTLDIIWSSFITIFLCSWTVLCLNVPPKRYSNGRWLWQKCLMTGWGILGPEFILQTAIAQWASARRSVEAFRSLGYTEWSMTHAFFADMGGFELHAEGWTAFPLNAKQVHYLLEKGYVSSEQVLIKRYIIDDKNKGDGMTRILTVGQIIWFSISTIARVIQNLAITTLELTTLGFIICTLGSYYFWAQKPMDIRTPITITPNTKLVNILEAAGEQPPFRYRQTPLDFVGRDEWRSWNLYWTYWMNILRHMGIVFHREIRPIEKISDDYVPALTTRTLLLLFLVHNGYAAVHVAGWNFHFPSPTEQLLWHIATVTILTTVYGFWFTDLYIWKLHPIIKQSLMRNNVKAEPTRTGKQSQTFALYLRMKIELVAEKLRNNSATHDPELTVPLKAIIPITIFAATYCIARAYILTEDLVNLKSQPPSVYQSVNWSDFLPHW